MVALTMKMRRVMRHGAPKGSLTKQDQLAKTFLFRRSHPALGKSVQVRTARRQDQAFRARGFEDRSKSGAELGVAIVQDVNRESTFNRQNVVGVEPQNPITPAFR